MTARRLDGRSFRFAFAVALSVCLLAPAGLTADKAAAVQEKPATAAQFDAIASRLDAGGDLYLILNVDGTVKQLMDWVAKFAAAVPSKDPAGSWSATETVAKLQAFLDANGMCALQGFGMSSVPRPDGMHSVKAFLARDPAAQDKAFWRAMVGAKPRRLDSLGFLPADSVMARACAGEPAQLWQLMRNGVNQVLPARAVTQFNASCAMASLKLGADVDKLINSMGNDMFLSVQLSETAVLSIPSPNGAMTIPEPSFVMGCKLNDNTLPDTIDSLLASNNIPVTRITVGTDILRSVALPPSAPVKWQPAYTVHAGYLVIGSSPDTVVGAAQAFDKKSGLVATPAFIKAFEGLPMVNNGIEYVSPRFTGTIADIQARVLQAQSGASPAQAGVNKTLMELLQSGGAGSGASVAVNLPSGVLMQATSSSGGREMLVTAMAAPVGMLAAIAIPSFEKARGAAVRNACVNNLRMIDAAKEQWALEQGATNAVEVTEDAVKKYLPRGAFPVCPGGGAYRINAFGTDPECSVPGHRLTNMATGK